MTKTAKIILGLSIVFVALSVLSVVLIKIANNINGLGIPSGPEIENYVPSIMYNDGYFSRKGIYTTSTLQADGATTLAGATTVSGSATFSSTLTGTGATTLATFTQGGGIRATSTVNSAETLLAADFDVENVIAYTLNVQDATLTLPATSTLSSFIATAGQTRSIFIRNATTTASMDLTIAGGTGMNLLVASSTKVIVGNTSGSNSTRLDFVRRADTDIDVTMSIFLK